MAVSFLSHDVSYICIGKPALRSLPVSATVGDALSALKRTGENYLSVWSCDHSGKAFATKEEGDNFCEESSSCRCIGKVCMVDIICYLSKEENLSSPSQALQCSVSVLVSDGLVRHLDPHSSVLEAIDLILDGAQNLVIPLKPYREYMKKLNAKPSFSSTQHNGVEYCWLTQEDVIRFLLNFVGVLSPFSLSTIESLDIMNSNNILALHYHNPASLALPLISESLATLTSVAIIDSDRKLVGEISPCTLACCDETVAAAIATLSTGDLMSYIDCGGPPHDLIKKVKSGLKEMRLDAISELIEDEYASSLSLFSSASSLSSLCSSSSDEESSGNGKSGRVGGYSARMVRTSEAILCYPCSSLVAVMIQALAHRVNYVWVVEEDRSLVGIVTFTGILRVFRNKFQPLHRP